jgi:hypothetical protein
MREVRFEVYQNGKWSTFEGWFHCWGYEVMEHNDGPHVQYSIGICEAVSGPVFNVQPNKIFFLS